MENFFRKHPDLILISLTVVFIAVMIGYFFWGITTLVDTFNRAIAPPPSDALSSGYDLNSAAQLNLKGLGPAAK